MLTRRYTLDTESGERHGVCLLWRRAVEETGTNKNTTVLAVAKRLYYGDTEEGYGK